MDNELVQRELADELSAELAAYGVNGTNKFLIVRALKASGLRLIRGKP